MVGDVVHLCPEVEPGCFGKMQREAANESDVQIVVAGTVEVVRRCSRSVAEGIGGCDRCIEQRRLSGRWSYRGYERSRKRCGGAADTWGNIGDGAGIGCGNTLPPLSIDADWAGEGRVDCWRAGALSGVCLAGRGGDRQR